MQGWTTKAFEVYGRTLPGGYYSLVVKFRGEVVDHWIKPTMKECRDLFERAGYGAPSFALTAGNDWNDPR